MYVIIDLVQILKAIEDVQINEKSRRFFKSCFVAIVKRLSKRGTCTVSGLEVTKIQSELNKTRKISVYKIFLSKVTSEIQNMAGFGMLIKTLRAKHQQKSLGVMQLMF